MIAFNYGGRDEIVRAARAMAEAAIKGDIETSEISAEMLGGFLDTAGIPDPDLVIRTSGEMRLSNFLLWQTAYSELVFLPCFWPDFNAERFAEAVRVFSERDRRFGGRKAEGIAS
jgi:undecaprenyl diphosphate synthase